MRGKELMTLESGSTRCGELQAPFRKRDTNGWACPSSLFRYTSAAEPSGATSTSGLAVLSIEFDGPSTVAPGRIAPCAGAAKASRGSSASALSQCLIQCLVHEFVRSGVLLPADRADRPPVETPQLSHGFGEKRLES